MTETSLSEEATTLSEETLRALASLRGRLRERAGDKLVALVVYGAAARGEHLPGRDPVNLLVVLRDTSSVALSAIAGPLQSARRDAGVQPYLVGEDELPRLADVFPLKVLELQRYHQVIHGEDPVAAIEVQREHLRLRVEQRLRNHLLRLRLGYVAASSSRSDVEALLRRSAQVLRVELEALLLASGAEVEPAGRAEIFSRAAAAFELDAEALEALDKLEREPAEDPEALAARLLDLLERAVQRADALEAQP